MGMGNNDHIPNLRADDTSDEEPAAFFFRHRNEIPYRLLTLPWGLLEPDITVVCDRDKLDGKGCKGAPDMVMEVLSPSTQRHDRLTKFSLYQRAGVREYWIVDPAN